MGSRNSLSTALCLIMHLQILSLKWSHANVDASPAVQPTLLPGPVQHQSSVDGCGAGKGARVAAVVGPWQAHADGRVKGRRDQAFQNVAHVRCDNLSLQPPSPIS